MSETEQGEVERILEEQRRVITVWHAKESLIQCWEDAVREIPVPTGDGGPFADALAGYAASITRINTYQWHEEDKARDPKATDARIAAIKRSIDASNQRRVDEIERLDVFLSRKFPPSGDRPRAMSSETPGCLIDRLSILLLKLYHTEEQLTDAPEASVKKFQERLRVQREQLEDLSAFLAALLAGLRDGSRGFKLYFQFKMYNDPETNPYMSRG